MRNIPILLVEDDILSNLETCDVLREYGFNVIDVDCALGAYKVLEKREPLLALVTDINLGAGADGYEIARIARVTYPGLPVIYFSGSEAARQLIEGVPGSRFISKPFFTSQVAEVLVRMTRAQGPTVAPGCNPDIAA